MTPRWNQWALALGLIALGVAIAIWQHDASQRALGASNQLNAILTDSLRASQAEGRLLDQRRVAETDSFRTQLAHWQALKQRIRTVVRDSLLPPDTVEGPERIIVRDSIRPPTLDEILRAADATIQRCSQALGTCEAQVGNLNEQLSLITQQRDLWRHRAQPSLWDQIKQLPGRAVSTAAIASVGYAACKIGGE